MFLAERRTAAIYVYCFILKIPVQFSGYVSNAFINKIGEPFGIFFRQERITAIGYSGPCVSFKGFDEFLYPVLRIDRVGIGIYNIPSVGVGKTAVTGVHYTLLWFKQAGNSAGFDQLTRIIF